jgi:chromosome segregation ATPase
MEHHDGDEIEGQANRAEDNTRAATPAVEWQLRAQVANQKIELMKLNKAIGKRNRVIETQRDLIGEMREHIDMIEDEQSEMARGAVKNQRGRNRAAVTIQDLRSRLREARAHEEDPSLVAQVAQLADAILGDPAALNGHLDLDAFKGVFTHNE